MDLPKPTAIPLARRPDSFDETAMTESPPAATPPRPVGTFRRLREVPVPPRDTKDSPRAGPAAPFKPLSLRQAQSVQEESMTRIPSPPVEPAWPNERSCAQSPRPGPARAGIQRSATDLDAPSGGVKQTPGALGRPRSGSVGSEPAALPPLETGASAAARLPLAQRLALMRALCAQPPVDRYGLTQRDADLRRAFWLVSACELGSILPASEQLRAGSVRGLADTLLPAAHWPDLSDDQRSKGLFEFVMAVNRRFGIEQEIRPVLKVQSGASPQAAIVQPERQTVIFNNAHADWGDRDKALGAVLPLHLRRYREELAWNFLYENLPSSSDKQTLACAFQVCEAFEDMDPGTLARTIRLPDPQALQLLEQLPSSRYDQAFIAAVLAGATDAPLELKSRR